jgi:DNA polymerase-3 subunit alpha
MAEQRKKFVAGCKERGIAENTANQIFDLMDKFAAYGFNKSHAAGYSVVAYQTGYLKAHYPAEFMAANLTSEMTTTSRIVTLIEDCKRMGLPILPPDVNESFAEFTVVDEANIPLETKSSKTNGAPAAIAKQAIRYGLGAIKNVGLGAIESIVKTREQKGKFTSLFDFCRRIDLRLANKKVLESLAQSGAMDSLSPARNRQQLLQALDVATAYAQSVNDQRSRGQVSIFDQGDTETLAEPEGISRHLFVRPSAAALPRRSQTLFQHAAAGFGKSARRRPSNGLRPNYQHQNHHRPQRRHHGVSHRRRFCRQRRSLGVQRHLFGAS